MATASLQGVDCTAGLLNPATVPSFDLASQATRFTGHAITAILASINVMM